MRKLADLYFNKRLQYKDLTLVSYANMRKDDTGLVEDLMRDAKVIFQINNACQGVMNTFKSDKEVPVAKFPINMSSAISSAAKIEVNIVLLKDEDENDLRITLTSLVGAPER